MGRRIVVIGAGVVGVAVADELTSQGESEVTVLDKGPLYATGGSSSHAPGLISRTSPSKMMQELADYTLDKFAGLHVDGAPASLPVGTLEIALNEVRLRELQRRNNFAQSWGWRGRMIEPEECSWLWPIIDASGLVGGYATEGEGLAVALRAVEAQARSAISRGARFVGGTEVTWIEHEKGRVTGVLTDGGIVPADVVVCCAGVWGPVIARTVGLVLPMLALEHQYVITSPVAELGANSSNEATMPIVRHHDAGLYFRDHGDRVGIGSFNHRRLPVAASALDDHPRREDGVVYSFTPEDFTGPWDLACELMPALRASTLERSFNGVFAFTPDGYPLMGEHPDLKGFWVAESVWVTHSAGVGRAIAEQITGATPTIDTSPADLSRFEEAELDKAVFEGRCDDSYRDVYLVHHPGEAHMSARNLRLSPFAPRQRELGGEFFDSAGWERPRWYEANAGLAGGSPDRDEWSSRYWSPIAAAEHVAVREGGGLFDMTPLTRIEVAGPGAEAFLLRLCAGRVDRPPGAVTYTVMLDEHGGIRSDVTVTRLSDERFILGGNSARDAAWLRSHAEQDVTITSLTDAMCCVGLWGPRSRQILVPLTSADLSTAAFPYMSVKEIEVAGSPVIATRISYAGELGWELATSEEKGLELWDALWESGQPLGLIAAGSGALKSLRLEKGYRAWGVDMTPEHAPAEAGLGFCVRSDGPDFIGRDAVRPRAKRRLATLVLEGDQAAMGGEPVFVEGRPVGYVTSADYGYSVGRSIALAWMPSELGAGAAVEIGYFDRRLGATVAENVLFDPAGTRLRA